MNAAVLSLSVQLESVRFNCVTAMSMMENLVWKIPALTEEVAQLALIMSSLQNGLRIRMVLSVA